MHRQTMKNILLGLTFVLHVFGTVVYSSEARSQTCKPSSKIQAKGPQPGLCSQLNTTDCCIQGRFYPVYKCSPPVSRNTEAVLTLSSFQKGGDGAMPSQCDRKYHSDDTAVVALSTGWFSRGGRCRRNISIGDRNGHRVNALVVDECDSTMGCDKVHHYQPPCSYNIVVASKAVWKALGVPPNEWGVLDVTWSDA